MKTLLLATWLALLSQAASAQLFKEWFRQNSTQRQYLREQIAELKIYLELTKNGYQIAKEGLAVIHQIKNKEFGLHKNRFDSLSIVKPAIGALPHLRRITDLHGSINALCEKLPDQISACEGLKPEQKSQFYKGIRALYQDCQVLLADLFATIRDGQLALTDEQRISRIQACYEQFASNYIFAQDLRQQAGLVCQIADMELKDIQNRRALHNKK